MDHWNHPVKYFLRLLAKLEVYKPGPNDDYEVFYEDGVWWFWDEVWCNKAGPYSSRSEAVKEIEKYAETL